MRNVPETVHAYNIPRLNWIFVFFSLLFVGAMVWMIWYDYAGYRTWKDYQREFQKYEAAKLHWDIQEDTRKAEKAGLGQIDKALSDQEGQIKANRDKIEAAEADVKKQQLAFERVDNQLKFNKADLDAQKYKHDVAFQDLSDHPNDPELKRKYEAAKSSLESLEAKVETLLVEDKQMEQAVKDAQAQVDQFVGERDRLTKEKQRLLTKRDLASKRLDTLTNVVVQAVLNAPFLEIAEPTIRVKQIVVENQLFNVNFAQVPRVDRCISCHSGINKLDAASSNGSQEAKRQPTVAELTSGKFSWADLPQPFTAHPDLDLYVGDNSPHPMDKFGCTACHWGWDRGMDFSRAAHTPDEEKVVYASRSAAVPGGSGNGTPAAKQTAGDGGAPRSESQKDYWVQQYGWQEMHHAEQKMRPGEFIESACLKCHSGQTSISHAEKLTHGIRLVEQAGCFNCHKMKPLETTVTHTVQSGEDLAAVARLFGSEARLIREANDLKTDEVKPGMELVVPVRTLTRTGPSLVKVATKVNEDWTRRWLAEPKRFRPNTFMPQFWGLENSYVRLTNISAAITYTGVTGGAFDMKDRDQVEIEAITGWVFALSEKSKTPAPPVEGDAARGRGLVEKVGCFACHVVNERLEKDAAYTDGTPVDEKKFPLLSMGDANVPTLDEAQYRRSRSQGPMLFGSGSKMEVNWLYAWLKDPRQYHPRTKMPNLRLSDQDASDIASYLVTLKNEQFEKEPLKDASQNPYRLVRDDEVQEYLEGELPKREAEEKVRKGDLGDKVSDLFRRTKYSDANALLNRWQELVASTAKYGGRITDDERKAKSARIDRVAKDMRETAVQRAELADMLDAWGDGALALAPTVVGWNDAEEKDRTQSVENARAALDAAQQQFARFIELQSAGLDAETQKKLYLGGKLLDRYGCFSCHEIRGYDTAKPIGTELSEWGTKLTSNLDFGYLHEKVEDNNYAYLEQKIQAPRSFDKTEVKKPQEWFKMPQYNFNAEQRKAIELVVMGMTDEKVLPQARKNLSEAEWQVENGRWIVKELNCVGCHVVEKQGGAILATMDAGQKQMFPPNLQGLGTKVKPTWLYHFLKQPGEHPYRYWLNVRMPTFGFSDEQVNTLTRYFALLDKQTYPFEADALQASYSPPQDMVATGEQVFDKFQCWKCHNVRPPETAGKGSNIGPDLKLVKDRMRPKGLVTWLKNPEAVTPRVNMPANWPVAPEDVNPLPSVFGGNTEKQIQAVSDYLLMYDGSFEAKHPLPKEEPAAAPAKGGGDKSEYE